MNTFKSALKTEGPPSDDQVLRRAVLYSTGLHVLLFVVFAVRAVFYSGEAISLDDAIRVDIVALPDKKSAEIPDLNPPPTASQKSKSESKPESKPEPAPKPVVIPKAEAPKTPAMNLDRAKKDQQSAQNSALRRLEALERLEQMDSKPAAKPKAAEVGETRPSTVVKGNQVSQGNSLTGLTRLEHRSYLANVQGQLKRYWRLPNWMSNQNYSARVRIWIDGTGTVIKKQMLRASGNSEFDERVMAAIEAAGTMPVPPSDLANILSVDGLDADFP